MTTTEITTGTMNNATVITMTNTRPMTGTMMIMEPGNKILGSHCNEWPGVIQYPLTQGQSMNKYMTQSESKRDLAAQQTQSDQHPGHGVITVPSHHDIAVRAYEIYVKSGHKQGQCRQNWEQAEHGLRTGHQQASAQILSGGYVKQ